MRVVGTPPSLRRREGVELDGVRPRRAAIVMRRNDSPVIGDMAASMIPWAFRPARYTGIRITAPKTARPPHSIPTKRLWRGGTRNYKNRTSLKAAKVPCKALRDD